jgi:two-component system sensor histidine kinase UhpB
MDRVVRGALVILGTCCAYFLSIRWGQSFIIQPELVAAFWPPTGLLTAVLLLVNTRYWPMVAGGALLTAAAAYLGVEVPLLATTWEHAIFDCAQCLAVAYLSRRFLEPPIRFDTFRQVIGFVVISLFCCGAASAMSATLLQGHPGSTSFYNMWRICWVSHSFGLLLITPAILSWNGVPLHSWRKIPPMRIVEGVLLIAVLIGATVYVFSGAPRGLPLLRLRSYIVISPLLWGAARFGARGASLGALVMISIAVYCTSNGFGPFALPEQQGSLGLVSLQMFMGAALLLVFLLAAVMHDQWNAQREIEQRNRELSAIHGISEIAFGSGTEEQVIDRIAGTIAAHTGFPYVAIELYDGTRERLLLKGARGFPVARPACGVEFELQNPLSLESARGGKALVETRSGERATYNWDLPGCQRIRTMICVPMVAGWEVFGTLTLGHTDLVAMKERPPGWVVSVAGTIAAVVDRNRAVEALRRYKADLEIMVDRRTKELRDANAQLTEEIRERFKAEASLRESESRFRSMYNTALQGIAIFDPADGIILEANRKFHEMLGYAGTELSGKSWYRQVHRDEGRAARDHVGHSSRGAKEGAIQEYRFSRNGGGFLWGRVALSIIPGEDGRPSLMAGMVDDVTDLHKYTDELLKYQEELRGLAVYLQTAREEERVRIAREIHDELGQMLTALKMDTVLLEGQLAAEIPAARAKLESMKATLDLTIFSVKRIAKELRPILLDHFGLMAAIEVYLKEFAQRTGIECRAVLQPDGVVLARDLSISVFRVCQEALTNIARHAQASRARVRMSEGPGMLCLTIADNGRGITLREISDRSSLGLIGIRERVRPFGGDFRIRGIRGRGTILSVRIPVHPNAMVG